MTAARIRRIAPDEAPTLRDIRLRALADAPLAFGSTHARELAYPPERWRRRAHDAAAGNRQAIYFVTTDEPATPIGLASGVIDGEDPEVAHLFAMWVAPEARATGAGAALVEAIVAWATDRGARTLCTSVTVGNDPAARLYARAGFRDTGVREPLGHSDADAVVLERPLAG